MTRSLSTEPKDTIDVGLYEEVWFSDRIGSYSNQEGVGAEPPAVACHRRMTPRKTPLLKAIGFEPLRAVTQGEGVRDFYQRKNGET